MFSAQDDTFWIHIDTFSGIGNHNIKHVFALDSTYLRLCKKFYVIQHYNTFLALDYHYVFVAGVYVWHWLKHYRYLLIYVIIALIPTKQQQ